MASKRSKKVGDIIQIIYPHKWAGCLAVVDEEKGYGCLAYISIPHRDEKTGNDSVSPAYINLVDSEYESVGAKAPLVAAL